jgi:hypothetical protein
VIDESSGVPQAFYDVMEGVMATGGNVKILATGNPNQPGGWFYDAFHVNRDLWRTMTINYLRADSVNREWAERMISEFGPDNDWVMVRILGKFPKSIEGGLIPLDVWEEAIGRERRRQVLEADPHARRSIGIDVAGEGSNQNIATRAQGKALISSSKRSGLSSDARLSWVQDEILEYGPHYVVVDGDGGYGAELCSRLAPWLASRDDVEAELVKWHATAAPRHPKEFVNARAELGWRLKIAVEAGEVAGLHDQRLSAQATGIRWERLKGRILLEPKKRFMARIRKFGGSASCDEFDSACYALVPALYRSGTIPKAKPKKHRPGEVSSRHERLYEQAIL